MQTAADTGVDADDDWDVTASVNWAPGDHYKQDTVQNKNKFSNLRDGNGLVKPILCTDDPDRRPIIMTNHVISNSLLPVSQYDKEKMLPYLRHPFHSSVNMCGVYDMSSVLVTSQLTRPDNRFDFPDSFAHALNAALGCAAVNNLGAQLSLTQVAAKNQAF